MLILVLLIVVGWGFREALIYKDILSTMARRNIPAAEFSTPAPPAPERRRQATPVPPPEPTGAQVRTLVDSNLRAGPGLEYDIAEVVPAGTLLNLVAMTPSADWLELDRGSWIYAELVDTVPDALPDNLGTQIKISAHAPLRAGPSRFFTKVGTVAPDVEYPVQGRNLEGTWLILQAADEEQGAWVRRESVMGIALDMLPVHISTATPDTAEMFNYLVTQSIVQTESPDQVEFLIEECGKVAAFAQIRLGQRRIVMCQEMLTQMWRDFADFQDAFPSALEYIVAGNSAILGVFLHEYAHVWIDQPAVPERASGLPDLGRTVAQTQELAHRYGSTFNEDIADLYATVVLIELAHELTLHPDSNAAVPTDYVALGPVMMGFVLAKGGGGFRFRDDPHSPGPERLATSLCALADGTNGRGIDILNNLTGFRERLAALSAERGRTCLQGAQPSHETYTLLLRQIEELLAQALPTWWG